MNTYFDGFSTGTKGRHGPDRMVVELKLHYAIGTYLHWCCGSDFRSWRGVHHYVIKFDNEILLEVALNTINHMSELSFQDWAASYYVKKGVPPEMMNIGMGVYGRSFTLSSPSNHDVGAPTRGAGDSGQFTGEKGFISYYEVFIVAQYNDT